MVQLFTFMKLLLIKLIDYYFFFYQAPVQRLERFNKNKNKEVCRDTQIKARNGLASADRNNKATLLLTGPFRTAKSSAKDLTPLVLKLQYAKYHDALRAPWRNRLLRH